MLLLSTETNTVPSTIAVIREYHDHLKALLVSLFASFSEFCFESVPNYVFVISKLFLDTIEHERFFREAQQMRSVDVNADADEAKEGIHHEARSTIKS